MMVTLILTRFLCIPLVLITFNFQTIGGYGVWNYGEPTGGFQDIQTSDLRASPAIENIPGNDLCPAGLKCVPPIQCPSHVIRKNHGKPPSCSFAHNQHGYCCSSNEEEVNERSSGHSRFRNFGIPEDILAEARDILQNMSFSHYHPLGRKNPEYLHQLVFQSPIVDYQKENTVSKWAFEQIFAGKLYSLRQHVSPEEIFNSIDMRSPNSVCLTGPKCTRLNSVYRTADGSCNNPLPDRSAWGSSSTSMERLLPPAYEDSIWSARLHSAVDGSPLPNARKISRQLLFDYDRPHPHYNLLFMQFGQFISHDFTQSSTIRNEDGESIQCCTDDGSAMLPPEELHYACMPIEIDPDDEYYGQHNQRCMNFVRLSLAPYADCRIGYGKQISKVTHYLDSSGIYGSDLETQRMLRSFQGGQLKLFPRVNGEMLPITNHNESCADTEEGKICYLSGDVRTNQIISLTLLQTLFAREHNRVASILAQINPHHTDEILFQEARRIVTAEIQHVIYSEYLPLLVGRSAMERFHLNPETEGYSTDYDPNVNVAILNEFTGAAFRFGHSTVDGKLLINTKRYQEQIEIPDVMFDPGRLEIPHFLPALMITLLSQNMQKTDPFITRGLSGNMFRGSKPFGLDIASLNIQRGRDQGIRSYNDYLELIGHRRIESFEQFGPISARLREVYNHPDDIDLWVGGLLEIPQDDAVIGRVFAEIIAEQFSRFKRGDRYFHSHSPEINPGYFTSCQLYEIRQVTLARLICDNIPSLSLIQPFALLTQNYPGNNLVRCDDLPKVNMACWKA